MAYATRGATASQAPSEAGTQSASSDAAPNSSSTSSMPTSSSSATLDSQTLLSSIQSTLAHSLAPLTQRLDQLEQQLQSPRNTNSRDADTDAEDSGATQQLQHELEGGNPPPVESVFSAAARRSDNLATNEHEFKVVSSWFSSVRAEHIRLILRNEFEPTDIVKLVHGLGKKERKKDNMVTLNEASGALELANSSTTEDEYAMYTFFQAWEVYRGIFIWGAPFHLRGSLAAALSVYTSILFKLIRSYSWPGARSYHFSFHQQRVTNPTTAYNPDIWRKVDTDLVSEHCLTTAHSFPPSQQYLSRSRLFQRPSQPRFHPYSASSETGNGRPTTGPLEARIRFPFRNNSGSVRRFGLCDAFNSRPDGCTQGENCRYSHACNSCGKFGHGAFQCTAPHSRR
ncbi:hypothetical protein BJ508DRAFT_331986 [Ascobolus immersus RN42]|uniref:C3H1-type domain-containing protein n=1 Tax=Ascobolus immersus RN42 TaxID=1160509 RepID=A0A3N4HP20_ASCIM|nr:hypothetical protein BJ508DRAFT_331986 [Ascobolus immersus RN42]